MIVDEDHSFKYIPEKTEKGMLIRVVDHEIDKDTSDEEIATVRFDLKNEELRLGVFQGLVDASNLDTEVAMFTMVTAMTKLVEEGILDPEVRKAVDKVSGGLYKVLMHNLEAREEGDLD